MDKNEAVEILKELPGRMAAVIMPSDRFFDYKGALEFAIKTLEADKWIPVSEGLPKEGNKAYLVTVDYGNGVIASCQRFFYNGGIGWNDDCVTAWQPLPKPYKESEGEA